MGYIFLLLTILLESAAVIFMKLSHGFQNKLQAGLAILAYALSFVFFTLALKRMDAGIANALWAGGSALLVAVAGVLFLKENISAVQWFFLALIITGIAGLQYSSAAQ